MICAITSTSPSTGLPVAYIIGALIALLILAYLLYALIKPEKF